MTSQGPFRASYLHGSTSNHNSSSFDLIGCHGGTFLDYTDYNHSEQRIQLWRGPGWWAVGLKINCGQVGGGLLGSIEALYEPIG